MAKLTKRTIQRLAVLRTLTLWQRGAYGPVRLHKTMFAADKPNQTKIFTFKKYYLGQYSEGISDALNALRAAGRLSSFFDGPAERLKAVISPQTMAKVRKALANAFPQWERQLVRAFSEWGYLSNDKILKKAHEDATYTETIHDQVIFESNLDDMIDISSLGREDAEELTDLVDEKFIHALRKGLSDAAKVPAESVDWRRVYFGHEPKSKKAV